MKTVLLVTALAILTGCTQNAGDARRILEADGVKDLRLDGYAMYGCGSDDGFRTKFHGTKSGKPVNGVLCGGWFKANTIRYF